MTMPERVISLTAAAGIPRAGTSAPLLFGLLEGEGIGPEITRICRAVLAAVAQHHGWTYEVRIGGAIGLAALRTDGDVLPAAVGAFCEEVFGAGGAILAGAGGGRFVYDMRRRFGLFLKLNPLRSWPEAGIPRAAEPIDILVVRENLGGLYQGASTVTAGDGGQRIEHRFDCSEADVQRLTMTAARIAAHRRGHLTVVAKESGLPEMSRLWFDCGGRAAAAHGVKLRTLDIDYAVYQFVAAPGEFDVVATPNCFGDIMADLGGIFCGSRGATYGASYDAAGRAVYQTNHGAAYDLAGTDTANPVGQIFSLAMMLHESYGRADEAAAIVAAVRRCWADGWRTRDMMTPGCRLAGTTAFGERVVEAILDAPSIGGMP